MGVFKKAAAVTMCAGSLVGLVGLSGAFAEGPPSPLFSDVVAAVGTGTITPGLTSVPTYQTSVTFDSFLLVAAGDEGVSAIGNFHFSGSSFGAETVAQGQGGGNLSGSLSGGVTYTRTNNIVQLSGNVSIGGDTDYILASACVFVPTSVNPVTSYTLLCTVALSSPGDSLIPSPTPTPTVPSPTPTVPPIPNVPPSPCTTVAGVVACASLTPTTTYGTYAVNGLSSSPGSVAGYVDTYSLTLPNGGKVTLPCAVLVNGSTTADPCATAGGTYVATLATLSLASTPIAAVRVCNADLVVTVDGIGINSFPAFTVC